MLGSRLGFPISDGEQRYVFFYENMRSKSS